MITTKSQNLGFVAQIDEIIEQFKNEVIRGKLQNMKLEYTRYRRSRGDGNCYYRAVGFQFCEQLLLSSGEDVSKAAGKLKRFAKNLKEAQLPEKYEKNMEVQKKYFLDNVRAWTEAATKKDEKTAEEMQNFEVFTKHFYESFLSDSRLDIALVWLVRALTAQFLMMYKAEKPNGLELVRPDNCLDGKPEKKPITPRCRVLRQGPTGYPLFDRLQVSSMTICLRKMKPSPSRKEWSAPPGIFEIQ